MLQSDSLDFCINVVTLQEHFDEVQPLRMSWVTHFGRMICRCSVC